MEIQEITDKNIWEKFISEYSPQSLFQSWNWGEVIKRIQNLPACAGREFRIQNLWRFGIFEGNKLVGISQVNKVNAKKGAFLHIRHGPIFSQWKKVYLEFLIDYLKKLNKIGKTKFLRLSPLIENNIEYNNLFKQLQFINSPIHAMDGEYCWVLNLKKSEEELLSGMRKTTRYLIRQAQKLGVEINQTRDKSEIEEFLYLYKQTAKRHNFVEHKGVREEFDIFLKNDQITLLKGYFQNKLISVALIIFYNNQAIYHHSASMEQKIPVNYLLQWEAIKEARKRNMSYYNFWGIAPADKKNHPWKGLTIFKQGFGGETVEYLHAKDLPLSPLYCTTYALELLRKLRKGY